MRTMPPRAEACSPTSSSRPSRSPQYPAKVQWAEPVTGSSGMPALGANTRVTQSMPGRSPAAVTMTQRDCSAATPAMSGRRARTVAALSTSTRTSARPRAKARTRRRAGARGPSASLPACRPRVSSSDGGGSAGAVGSAGKSISIQPSSAGVHTSSPLRVWNVPAPPSTWAEASVACPHRSTSSVGVNQRRS